MSHRILIVDDDPDIREVAKVALEAMRDWTILEAADGIAGVRCATAERPDLILLDYMMPQQDGEATLRILRSDPTTADIPVIILTAKTQEGLEERLLEAGARSILRKPFDPLTLADELEQRAGWHP